MKKFLLPALFFISCINGYAQSDREMIFPRVPGYELLISDLHMHTVFSDGSVWPDIRVWEAVKDGLDVIATTEHLEYQPHREDIPHPNRNRSFELASKIAARDNLIVIPGSEITRDMPPGHSNAIFIQDANKLLMDDVKSVFREANRQGAFTFWNHPMWAAQYTDGVARLSDLHKELIAEKLLHGIEVVNEHTYSDEALQIALDNNLTILGTSDIHGLIDWEFEVPQGGHRPVTLLLAEDRTPESIKKALFEGRTVVWFRDLLIGKDSNIMPLLRATITIEKLSYNEKVAMVTLRNNSSVAFTLENISEYNFYTHGNIIHIEPLGTITIGVKTLQVLQEFHLDFRVLNGITAPNTHPKIEVPVR